VVSGNLKDGKAPITSFNLDPGLVKVLEKNYIPYFFPGNNRII
jgi:hypothetical protein